MYSDSRKQLIVEVAEGGETPFVVYGKGTDFRLIPLDKPIDGEALAQDISNGRRYCGVLGVVDGIPKLAHPPGAGIEELEVMRRAGVSFARQVLGDVGDELHFLNRLWALPDTRIEVAHA